MRDPSFPWIYGWQELYTAGGGRADMTRPPDFGSASERSTLRVTPGGSMRICHNLATAHPMGRLTHLNFGAYHFRLAFSVGTPPGRPKTFYCGGFGPIEVTYG